MTAANLQIQPDASGYHGFVAPNVPTDPQFGAYPSTSAPQGGANDTVLLPGPSSAQNRYVLGPAGLTGAQVKSASAQLVDGQWMVNIALTRDGATHWDALARAQFHAMIGIDVDGKVIAAPIIQPTQGAFASFGGQLQVSGLTHSQAEALAAKL
ncbi:MAG TPA: hypothetical protein VHZ02_05710 [Acidimicrobiales bacterium]|nr:hypothetical protein [Acidimicrobiales bacterium]